MPKFIPYLVALLFSYPSFGQNLFDKIEATPVDVCKSSDQSIIIKWDITFPKDAVLSSDKADFINVVNMNEVVETIPDKLSIKLKAGEKKTIEETLSFPIFLKNYFGSLGLEPVLIRKFEINGESQGVYGKTIGFDFNKFHSGDC